MTSAPAKLTDRLVSQGEREVWRILAEVPDPEIPVLNVVELGIIRHVRLAGRAGSPWACRRPTPDVPRPRSSHHSIESKLQAEGYEHAKVESVLSPAWTSDWLTDSARTKLKEYGIAPPAHAVSNPKHLFREPKVTCPRCASVQTQKISEFGSTPCKASYKCSSCLEPFEYFKCI